MQIIFVGRHLARARTLTVSPRVIVGCAALVVMSVLLSVAGLYAVTFHVGMAARVPLLHDFVDNLVQGEVVRHEQHFRDNLDAMARKLGEMQARLMRLDALGERVSKLAGFRPEEFNFHEPPARGGPSTEPGSAATLEQLQSATDRTSQSVESRSDYMDVVESELMAAQVRRALLPQNAPVVDGFVGSPYGMRLDPFTGHMSMHAGIDFAAPIGTPIYAAAGGVVSSAEVHPEYGKMVEIDHGNGLSTLYGHASRLLVKPGDIVRRGQKVAEIGTTGRSTGPHVHFEVHVNGTPQNPARFLAMQKPDSPLAQLAPHAALTTAPVIAAAGAPAVSVSGATQPHARPVSQPAPTSPPASPPSAPAAAAEPPAAEPDGGATNGPSGANLPASTD